MTFSNIGGFLIDITGSAGDLAYGMNDNYYDPCSPRLTVGVGEKVPVAVRASGAVVVQSGQSVDVETQENNAIEITAQGVSVGVTQPGGASNPVRQEQPQSVTQPQTIAVVPTDKAALEEFAKGYEKAGVTLLTPKVVDAAKVAAEGTLLRDAANVTKVLGQQIAVEVEASRQTAALLSQADELLYQQLAQQLRNNQANLQSILQKAGVGFDDVNNIRNSMFSSDASLLQKALQKVSDKVPAITKSLQTTAQNIAVRACG